MTLQNSEVINNLTEQKTQLEQQMEQLKITYYKIIGAIDALTQIESSKEVEEIEEVEE